MILEWREEVLLGMTKLVSPWSRVGGRSPVRGRREREGAMVRRGKRRNAEGSDGRRERTSLLDGGDQGLLKQKRVKNANASEVRLGHEAE